MSLDHLDTNFNSCLILIYKDSDSLGLHADDEKDIDPNSPIATISCGEVRDMQIQVKDNPKDTRDFPLPHGSLEYHE